MRHRRNGTWPNDRGEDATDASEVGSIRLGDRRFAIVRAGSAVRENARAEACRFEVDGVSLAVLAPAADTLGDGEDTAGRLTGRELEIAVLVAQGHPTKTIAYRLQISEWTVATYIRRIYCKLNVDNRAAMVYRLAALIDARVSHGGRHAGTDRSGRAAR